MFIRNFLKIRPSVRLSHIFKYDFAQDNKDENKYGFKIDEESIKRKIKEIKQRQANKETDKKPQKLLKNYKMNKVKPQTQKFRQSTNTEALFNIQDVSLDQKPTCLQINSFTQQMIQVDQFAYPPSVILTPHQLFIWQINSIKQLKVEHLKLIQIISPPPSYVIIGSKNMQDVPAPIRTYLQNLGINFDILDIFEAVSNFNAYSNDQIGVMAFINSS